MQNKDAITSISSPSAATVDPSLNHGFGSGVGLDTGAILASGLNPAKAISRLATMHPGQPAQLRLTDHIAGRRVAVGDGELDELSVDVACQVAGYRGYAVVDLRGITGGDVAVSRIWSK